MRLQDVINKDTDVINEEERLFFWRMCLNELLSRLF